MKVLVPQAEEKLESKQKNA